MMITDPYVHNLLHPPKAAEYAVMVVFNVGVIALGKWILLLRKQVALEPAQAREIANPQEAIATADRQGYLIDSTRMRNST